MLYEDPTKDVSSDERFHVELHFSPGVNCCVQKELPPGPGFRPHSRKENILEESLPAAASIGVPPPPPPLVCSIKCSEQDVGKIFKSQTSMPYEDVFDLNEHDQLVNPCNVHAAAILDDVIEELSENDEEVDAKMKNDTTSEPIEIKSSRKEQSEDDKVSFLKLLLHTSYVFINYTLNIST